MFQNTDIINDIILLLYLQKFEVFTSTFIAGGFE